jgi:hypothetical protein
MKLLHRELKFELPLMSTMHWDGEGVFDVTSGVRVRMDGVKSSSHLLTVYEFDRAIGLHHRGVVWTVAYANRQTKAAVFRNGKLLRELNRSFYCAHAYDYPIALAVSPADRAIVIHCPEYFDILEIEDLETGTTLARLPKTPEMEFHSRLAVSHDNRYLLDAGWFWHPFGGACVFDLPSLIQTPERASAVVTFEGPAEIDSAAFLNGDKVVVTSTDEDTDSAEQSERLGRMQLGVWSLTEKKWSSKVNLAEPSGMIMPWREWVISFYGYPKAIDPKTGTVVYRWQHLYSGKQIGSVDLGNPEPPPIALDPRNGRFAVASASAVHIITLDAAN